LMFQYVALTINADFRSAKSTHIPKPTVSLSFDPCCLT
jgi:hypothetical protein